MTEIQGGRWDNVLRRLFPVKGGAVAAQLAPELVPTVAVQDFDLDMYWLRGERLLSAGVIVGVVGGQFAQVNLRNDSTDKIVIVESVSFSDGSGGTTFSLVLGNNPVGATASVFGRDARAGPVIAAGSAAGVLRWSTELASISGDGWIYRAGAAVADVMSTVALGWVLPPTYALFLTNRTAAHTTYCNFSWRERPIEMSEV